ncbi:MAG TPA: MXAN_5187 C-terminal domain-containing protein [Candidatus Acidoferrales bacterium]|nr:MXAN_5187 C-terminal domain-containing protein [Candidatus Acidoferrales bacterium]
MTTEEELELLDTQLRRLKIEYEIFFNNPAKRPPTDVEWKVLSLIRKFSDGKQMTFQQRYRYNEMAQRYAIQSDLWRKKMRIREEGYRRPCDAMLSVQGVRTREEREAKRPVYGLNRSPQTAATETPGAERGVEQPFTVQCSGGASEREQVESLYKALTEAKERAGESVSGDLESFAQFVRKKTGEIRKRHHCDTVVYSIEMQSGHVKLKAKAKG